METRRRIKGPFNVLNSLINFSRAFRGTGKYHNNRENGGRRRFNTILLRTNSRNTRRPKRVLQHRIRKVQRSFPARVCIWNIWTFYESPCLWPGTVAVRTSTTGQHNWSMICPVKILFFPFNIYRLILNRAFFYYPLTTVYKTVTKINRAFNHCASVNTCKPIIYGTIAG